MNTKHTLFLTLIILLYSCVEQNENKIIPSTENDTASTVQEIETETEQTDLPLEKTAVNFTEQLKTGAPLFELIDDNWTLSYYEDNRCTGTTDGERTNLSNTQIDTMIVLNVKNNSQHAWACDPKAPYKYDFNFDLKKQIENWDRIELEKEDEDEDNPAEEKGIFYIFGGGASDYMKIYVGKNQRISKLVYISEDPG